MTNPFETNPRSNATSMTGEKIPVVFFGRLEMRKGICTFVEAIQQLDASTKAQIKVNFFGKSVQIHALRFGELRSDQYIEQQLESSVEYQIYSDLYSQEAIQLITELNHPIVCLTSHQENFPNSALEMGQLPVTLVVSETGGFQETLRLINRSTGVFWFKPEDAGSLSRTMTEAIAHNTETISCPNKNDLFQVNQDLLAQKINFLEQAFNPQKVSQLHNPKVTIGVTCYYSGKYLVECLTSIEAQTYRNIEVIVLSNASSDPETLAQLTLAQSLFPNYQFIKTEVNSSKGNDLNRIIEYAKGDYFLGVDASNRLLPFALEKFVAAAQKSRAAIVIAATIRFGSVSRIDSYRNSSITDALQMNYTGDICSLFSIPLLKKFKYPEKQDCDPHEWYIISAAIATEATIIHYPYPLYEYRDTATTPTNRSSLSKERYYLRQYLAQIPSSEWSQRQLYMLMTGVQQLNAQLSASQAETAVAKAEAQAAMAEAQAAKAEAQTAKTKIIAMETSKFWKLRKGWFKIKPTLGLPTNEQAKLDQT